jgi:hypothetical protein
MDERREGIEHADAHMAAMKADRIRDRVAIDGGAGHSGVDESDVNLGQARFPRHGSLRLAQRVLLD